MPGADTGAQTTPEIKTLNSKQIAKVKFILVNTNKQRDGIKTISQVQKLQQRDPQAFEETIGALQDTTESIIEEIFGTEGDGAGHSIDQLQLMDLISMN